jgi:hypothetical protein
MTKLALTPAATLGDIVDLERYPITDRTNPAYQALVTRSQPCSARKALRSFRGSSAMKWSPRWRIKPLRCTVHVPFRESHTVYFKPQDDSVEPTHPLRRLMSTEKDTVAYADIPTDHLIRQIYQSDDVLSFIRDVLNLDVFHRHADPLAALNLQGFSAGNSWAGTLIVPTSA